MSASEKLALIEEALDTAEETLAPETVLADLAEWDSISALSLVVMLDEHFGKTITGAEIKSFKTVKDIMDFMS